MGSIFKRFVLLLLLAAVVSTGCATVHNPVPSAFSRFIGWDDFSRFTRTQNERGETVLWSPEIKPGLAWNQLIVSWNAEAPAGTEVKIEARAMTPGHVTKFYALGDWAPGNRTLVRSSVRNQKDADGNVDTDTLVLVDPAAAAQIRLILVGTNGVWPNLKYLGASFSNIKVTPAMRPANHAAWGKIIATPERSQHGYPGGSGWCSPTSLSMVLARWSDVLHRAELKLTVPEVAGNVYDAGLPGTGNWPFNTAYAGSFDGMRSYVTRLDDISEVEDWIAAGIPVVLSARWDWLQPGRPLDSDGHLIVCIGFTETGDVVINDPATNLQRGESVRHIYKRENVIRAWGKSHQVVYLVYPDGAMIPENRYDHW